MPRAKLRRSKRCVFGFALGSTSGYGLRCSGAAPRPFIGLVRMPRARPIATDRGRQHLRSIDDGNASLLQRRPQHPVAARGGPGFSIVFDEPPETAACATGFVSYGNSAARAEPRRAGPGGEVLRVEPAVIPFGIDGTAPQGRHGAGAFRILIEETTSSAWL